MIRASVTESYLSIHIKHAKLSARKVELEIAATWRYWSNSRYCMYDKTDDFE